MGMDREIYDKVIHWNGRGDYKAVVECAEEAWPVLSMSRSSHVGEVCRFAGLSCRRLDRIPEAFMWKARALATHALVGCLDGVACIVMQEAFAAAKDPAAGLAILEEMQVLLSSAGRRESDATDPGVMARLFHEKKGHFLQLLGRYSEACEAYTCAIEAAEAAKNRKGVLKSRAGRALCLFWVGEKDAARRETEEVLAAAQEEGRKQIIDDAQYNLGEMSKAAPELKSYEDV